MRSHPEVSPTGKDIQKPGCRARFLLSRNNNQWTKDDEFNGSVR